MSIKQMVKSLIPYPILSTFQNLKSDAGSKVSTQEIFSQIYETGAWGKSDDPSQPFFSGNGSHDASVVSAYVKAVQSFLTMFNKKPNVVDLGCGDFFVGSQIRHLCDNYVACDIVPKLIEFNKRKYDSLDVDFKLLDLTTQALPFGEVVFIRQVLQHLSNRQIRKLVPKIRTRYQYLVLTEHLPSLTAFQHNLDMPASFNIRLERQSGVVLTSPPFNLKPVHQRKLCEIPADGGLITTTLYQLW